MTNLSATSFIKSGLNLSRFDGVAFDDINATDTSAIFVRVGGKRMVLEGDYTYNASTGAVTGTVTGLAIQSQMRVDGVDGRYTTLRLGDLSLSGTELVNLIKAQSNYQANAKTISTQSTIMQTIIQMT